jgi:hypothetical protein
MGSYHVTGFLSSFPLMWYELIGAAGTRKEFKPHIERKTKCITSTYHGAFCSLNGVTKRDSLINSISLNTLIKATQVSFLLKRITDMPSVKGGMTRCDTGFSLHA